MGARCCRWLVRRRSDLWHLLRIAFVVEALIGMIDRDAPQKRFWSCRVVLNDDDLKAERSIMAPRLAGNIRFGFGVPSFPKSFAL
jgi:hypothetical protein